MDIEITRNDPTVNIVLKEVNWNDALEMREGLALLDKQLPDGLPTGAKVLYTVLAKSMTNLLESVLTRTDVENEGDV